MSNIPETGRTRRVTIRLVVLQILVLSLLATLGGRLWYLQIRNGSQYTAQASNNHIREVISPAIRGEILDADGRVLVNSQTKLVVSVSRTSLLEQKDHGKAALTKLAQVLGMNPKDVQDKVRLCDAKTSQPCWNGSPYQPIPVTDQATTQQAMQIMERREDFPGITAQPTAVRQYPGPDGANTAQVLGYLSPVTDDEVTRTANQSGKNKYLPSDQIGRAKPGVGLRQRPARHHRRGPPGGGQPRPGDRQPAPPRPARRQRGDQPGRPGAEGGRGQPGAGDERRPQHL